MRFVTGILAVVVLALSATAVKAQSPSDPTVDIDKFPDPVCTENCFSTNSATDPLIIANFDTDNIFTYTGTSPLTELFVELSPILEPGLYGCMSDIFAACEAYDPAAISGGQEFEFYDGTLDPNTEIDAVVSPEPGALLLLAIGFAPLFAFRKRTWGAAQAA